MDSSELIVQSYLERIFKMVVYEPDGNTPPDFLADDRVAVEVRRLNQNYVQGETTQGLEEAAIPLWKRMRQHLLKFGPSTTGESWWVFYRFSRPIPEWRVLSTLVDQALAPYVTGQGAEPIDKALIDGFEIKVFRSPIQKSTLFLPAGHSDEQSGGFLISEIEANLKLCIEEKTKKLSSFRAKYPEWWLVLPDYIGWGLNDFDQELFRDQVKLTHGFDKVVLLDPRDSTRVFEV